MANEQKGIRNNIKNMMDKIYGKSYYNPAHAKNTLDGLNSAIDTSMNNIIDKNITSSGNNLSRLYARVTTKDAEGKEMSSDIEDIFQDDQLMQGLLYNYMENKYIRDLDLEVDTICKYMPKLEDALNIKRDAVLSADIFNKTYLNITNVTGNNDETFASNIKELQRIYKLSEQVETSYDQATKYGEQFVYILPYTKAFTTLLKNKEDSNIHITESEFSIDGKINKFDTTFKESGLNMKITLSGEDKITSIINESKSNYTPKETINSDKLDLDDLKTNDGFINVNKKEQKVDVPGCIIRTLNRENVLPIYIDKVCLGYYYIESEMEDMFEYVESVHDPLSKMKRVSQQALHNTDTEQESMLRQMSSKLSDAIDAKFINKNQDLRKELYFILKHSQTRNEGGMSDMKVTFIPPEDMVHICFNKDPRTNRGISDLANSLLPAKLYSCLYITNTIGILTRSQDKRAYFVKQHVDTNISQLMLNTINQIKKSNFGMREINNMNNVLNIAGRYNDYVIPESQGGERPINFEVIPGQEINTQPEFMEKMESMAISPIVPLELIDASRSIEFARQITTSNGTFARSVLKRQAAVQEIIGTLVSKVYNHHFGENDILECILPPPSYLIISNTTELMRNTKDLVADILENELTDDERNEPWAAIYRKNLTMHYLSTYINVDNLSRIKAQSKIEASQMTSKNNNEQY